MSDDVRRRLEEAGRRPVPPPDEAVAAAREARLLAIARTGGPSSSAPEPSPAPGPGGARGPWLVLGGLAVAALLLAVAVGVGTARPAAAPELARPVNVEVALADGTTLEDPDGLRLPEGAVVTVGAGGSARIGDVVLGPGDVATVEGGRVSVEHAPPVGGVPKPSAGAATPRPTPSRPTPSPRDRSSSPSPRPTREPTPAPSRGPAATPPPTAAPTREPTPAPTARPTDPAPTPTPAPAIVRPRLRARLVDGPRIAVRWTETWSATGYVLVATASRVGPAPDPVYPGSRVLGEFAAPPARALRFRVPDGVTEVRLMVVAVRDDGRVLRRSRIVTIEVPPPGDVSGSGPDPSPSPSPTPIPTPSPGPTPAP